jgi:hypothetical protein
MVLIIALLATLFSPACKHRVYFNDSPTIVQQGSGSGG